jgi:hypothetical protein
MLVKIFELIKENVLNNDFLSNIISRYALLELREDDPVPYLLFNNFRSGNIYAVNGDLICIEVDFLVIFCLDDYDESSLSEIMANINIAIRCVSYVDDEVDVKISINDSKFYRDNDLWRLNYSFSGIIFLKNKLLY